MRLKGMKFTAAQWAAQGSLLSHGRDRLQVEKQRIY